jgi:hypothetical protein
MVYDANDFQRRHAFILLNLQTLFNIKLVGTSMSGLENREYGSRDPPRWPRDNLSIC